MAISRSEIITVLNSYHKQKEKANAIKFLVNIGLNESLVKVLIVNNWQKSNLGATVYKYILDADVIPDTLGLRLKAVYEVVKDYREEIEQRATD